MTVPIKVPRPRTIASESAVAAREQWGDDVCNQGTGDGTEGTADDNADCHLQRIAAGNKLFEFFDEFLHGDTSLSIIYGFENRRFTKFTGTCLFLRDQDFGPSHVGPENFGDGDASVGLKMIFEEGD